MPISLERLTARRRELHRVPELDKDLPETLSYIKSQLETLACHVFSPCPSTVCAYFDFGKKDAAAFRSDMDALPVVEKTGRDFCSLHKGKMHACGHDGHMAMLLELAELVNESRELPHNVLLIFQPAEETTGGAKEVCQSGIFEKYNVKHIFGMHLWPALPAGRAASKRGDMLARSSEVTVEITGKSSHIARAFEGRDALLSAVLFIQKAYDMAENEVERGQNRLLKFGKLESGTARNAISADSLILGSLRSFAPTVFDFMRRRLYEIASEVSDMTGCRINVDINEGYPAVINDDGLFTAVEAHGVDFDRLKEPFMIAEDFSYYGLKVPSVFFLLGTGSDEPLHSDRFDFDEKVLVSGVELFEKLLTL